MASRLEARLVILCIEVNRFIETVATFSKSRAGYHDLETSTLARFSPIHSNPIIFREKLREYKQIGNTSWKIFEF